jgi:hypothetical protein
MSANDDYVGHQINCPSCQAAITVPPNPAAAPAEPVQSSIAIATPPGMPPPPAPPKVARLSVSALGSPQAHAAAPAAEPDQQGSAAYQALKAHGPKKSYVALISTVASVLVIGGLAYWGYMERDWVKAKWKSIRGPTDAEKAAAAAAAAEAAKPVPPPEMTAAEIMQRVAEVYKGLPSFSSTGKSTAILDMSAVSPAQAASGPKTASYDITLKMGKPLNFRIDMVMPVATSNVTVTGWSTGNGDFIQANNRRSRLASDDDLFSRFTSGSSIGITVGIGEIVRLFEEGAKQDLDDPNIPWLRSKDANLNGQQCYVLAGMVKLQPVLVWVNRRSFLIPQTQVVMNAAAGAVAGLDDAQIKEALKAENNGKEPTLLQIANVKKRLKTTGSVTDTYDNIQTNATIAAADFQPAAPVVATPVATSAQNGGNEGGGGGGGGGGRGGGGGGGRRGR